MTNDRMISKAALAEHFNCTARTIDNWVRRGLIPAPRKLPNGRDAWPESDVARIARGTDSPQSAA
jgi:DNA-binding transcriptional MerR regulator